MPRSHACLIASLTAFVCLSTSAQPVAHVGSSRVHTETDRAVFCCLNDGDLLTRYSEAGLIVSCEDTHSRTFPCGFDDSEMYYPRGGVDQLILIRQAGGFPFDVLEMNVSNGWTQICPVYLWIQAFENDVLVAEFDLDVGGGDLVGLHGGGFDEIRIGAYETPGIRDQHNAANDNGLALDNVAYGEGGLVLDYKGPMCPGEVNVDVFGATPNGTVGLLYATCAGSYIAPWGACAGTQLGICAQNAELSLFGQADANGEICFVGFVSQAACGGFIQAIDAATCETSNVEQVN